jgi:hypothetical protein
MHEQSAYDPELQAVLARDALLALDQLLTALPPGDSILCSRVGAIVRLIAQAVGVSLKVVL